MRERMLAVVQGKPHDRVPFVQYDNIAAPNEEIWQALGRDNLGILRWTAVHRFEHPNCALKTEAIRRGDRAGVRTALVTPKGELTEERLFEPVFGTSRAHPYFVKKPADYGVLLEYLNDIRVVPDLDQLRASEAELGRQGLPHVNIGRTPYQQLWVQWVSLEDLCLHLVDCPDVVEACMHRMADIMREIFRIIDRVQVPYVVIGDNITAPVIGPAYFERYCLPYYNEFSRKLKERGLLLFVHMDGDLKPLWEDIGDSGVGGLDSLSPPPDNDTSAGTAASLWPEMRLLLNFPSSVHMAKPKQIRAQTEKILAEAGRTGRLQIQISENVPPGRWRESFPQIVGAIQDFGPPDKG
jgi:hypothetical protein